MKKCSRGPGLRVGSGFKGDIRRNARERGLRRERSSPRSQYSAVRLSGLCPAAIVEYRAKVAIGYNPMGLPISRA
jgi:hypothetical protein